MASGRLLLVALLFEVTLGANVQAHARLRSVLQHRLRGSRAALETQPADQAAASRTLLTLDTNHDGRVDPAEVAAFARTQGLDPESATKEFAGLDKNGDGMLDGDELSMALETDVPDAETPESSMLAQQTAAQVQPAMPQAVSQVDDAVAALREPVPELPQAAAVMSADPALALSATQPAAVQAAQPVTSGTDFAAQFAVASPAAPQFAANNVGQQLDLGASFPELQAQAAQAQLAVEQPQAYFPTMDSALLLPMTAAQPVAQPVSSQQMLADVDSMVKSAEVNTGAQTIASIPSAAAEAPVMAAVETDDSSKAQNSANTIVSQLQIEEHEGQEALQLERTAAELRANSTALARVAMQNAMDQGAQAANEKAQLLLQKLMDFQEKAKNAEVEAAVLRAKSKAELKQADELMAVANAALTGGRM